MDPSQSRKLARTAWNLGVRLVEVPIANEAAWSSLEAVRDESTSDSELVGAGSITKSNQVEMCLDNGIKFLVSPGFTVELAEITIKNEIPWLPGVSTSSEIMSANSYGFSWMKAFPASQLGTKWFKAQLDPFLNAKFVATGGINSKNAHEFISSGAKALGVGSGVANPKSLKILVKSIKQ